MSTSIMYTHTVPKHSDWSDATWLLTLHMKQPIQTAQLCLQTISNEEGSSCYMSKPWANTLAESQMTPCSLHSTPFRISGSCNQQCIICLIHSLFYKQLRKLMNDKMNKWHPLVRTQFQSFYFGNLKHCKTCYYKYVTFAGATFDALSPDMLDLVNEQ